MLVGQKLLQARASNAEIADFRDAARLTGLTLSAWLRQAARLQATEALRSAGREPRFLKDAIRGAPKPAKGPPAPVAVGLGGEFKGPGSPADAEKMAAASVGIIDDAPRLIDGLDPKFDERVSRETGKGAPAATGPSRVEMAQGRAALGPDPGADGLVDDPPEE